MVKIFVGNINPKSKSCDLRALFENFGKVTECDIVSNFGFVHMDSESASQRAIEAIHGTELDNSKLNVEKSKPKRGSSGSRRSGERSSRGDERRPRDRDRRGFENSRDYYPPRSSGRYPPEPYGNDRPYSRDPYRDPYPPRDPLPPPPVSYSARDPYRSSFPIRERSPLPRPAYDYDRYYDREDPYDYPPSYKSE